MNLAAQDGRQSAAAQFRAPGLPPGNSAAANAPESLLASSGWVGVTRLVLTDFRNYRSKPRGFRARLPRHCFRGEVRGHGTALRRSGDRPAPLNSSSIYGAEALKF